MLQPQWHMAEQADINSILTCSITGAGSLGFSTTKSTQPGLLSIPCRQHALYPSQCICSRWEERCATFLVYVPTPAPQKPGSSWCLLCLKMITSELTCESGMIQKGAASPADWSHSRAAGPVAQELGANGHGFMSFYPSAPKCSLFPVYQKGFGGRWLWE